LLIVTLRSEIADHGCSGLIIRAADLLWYDACTSDGHTGYYEDAVHGQSERNAI
jgi:hypothetical protein